MMKKEGVCVWGGGEKDGREGLLHTQTEGSHSAMLRYLTKCTSCAFWYTRKCTRTSTLVHFKEQPTGQGVPQVVPARQRTWYQRYCLSGTSGAARVVPAAQHEWYQKQWQQYSASGPSLLR
eukprot:2961641-Rhodomonas_salina.1